MSIYGENIDDLYLLVRHFFRVWSFHNKYRGLNTVENQDIEKVEEYNYLGQTLKLESNTLKLFRKRSVPIMSNTMKQNKTSIETKFTACGSAIALPPEMHAECLSK